MDDQHSNENEPIGIVHRTMLQDREEPNQELETDADEEKSSIERKTIYDNIAQKEHFFSKTDIKASDDFEKEMLKKKELDEERREELIVKERLIKKAKLQEEIETAKRNGEIVDSKKYAELERLNELTADAPKKVQTNDLANELNRRISHDLHNEKEEMPVLEKSIHNGILAAIALEVVLVFVFVPNQIFIFPTVARFVLAIISIILALISVIILIVVGNMAEKHIMPKRQHIIYLSASIFPGAILRVLFGTLLANALSFIPVAGNYIGYCFGVAIGAVLHYLFLNRFRINLNQGASIINSLSAIILFIIPNLISGTINQPMDEKSQFGYAIFIIEAFFMVIVDEIVFMIFQNRKNRS